MTIPRPDRPKISPSFAAASAVAVAVALGALGMARSQDPPAPRSRTDAERIKGLEEELTSLAERYEKLSHDVNDLANFSPPIGSVIAYPGKWPVEGPGRDALEAKMGWMLCDGRVLWLKGDNAEKYADLAASFQKAGGTYLHGGSEAEGRFKLPDYQGYFLRGVAHGTATDPDRDSREGGDAAGSKQLGATAMPATPGKQWTNSTNGAHSHHRADGFNFLMHLFDADHRHTVSEADDTPNEPWLAGAQPVPADGDHSHAITGGDTETRPINRAVEWIIKFK